MLFRFALLLLFLWYIRPQDWIGPLNGVGIVKPMMLLWGVAWYRSTREVRCPVPGFLKSPHDYAVLAYYLYVVLTSPRESGALMGMLAPVAFYALTVQSIASQEQLHRYLKFWNWMLVCLSAFAVLSLYGLDITGGESYTKLHRGRLALGTWIHNNPNALGHTIVVALPLSYIFLFRGKSAFSKFAIFPFVVALTLHAAWETQSKGSYLVGALLCLAVYLFDKGWVIRITALGAAAIIGTSALSFMPRMEQMGNLRSDEGVQGRLLAWEHARLAVQQTPTGEGYKMFEAVIPWQDGKRRYMVPIATHSSYVQIAADLGYYGMFLFVLCLITASKSVCTLKPASIMEKDSQHAIGVLLLSYMVSGWMINREYHTEYFLTIAAAASYHRLHAACHVTAPPKALQKSKARRLSAAVPSSATTANVPIPQPSLGMFKMKDLAINSAATASIFVIWDYLLRNV